jgi:hypothetical protein
MADLPRRWTHSYSDSFEGSVGTIVLKVLVPFARSTLLSIKCSSYRYFWARVKPSSFLMPRQEVS